MRILTFLLIAFVSAMPANGQTSTKRAVITGYVVDANNYPVIGGIIMIDHVKTNLTTDEKGYYKIRVNPAATSIGIFSFTYGVIEEPIKNRTRINFAYAGSVPNQIVIKNPAKAEEQINIGYGTVDRKNLTSAVSKIDGRDQRYSSYNSIYDMLQGLPGVFVNRDNILIRGVTSFRLSNEPLFIVDGVPVTSIADIPPQMVKSIEVLKGSASAIYGSRGANGVILVDLIGSPSREVLPPAPPGMMPFAATRAASNIQPNSATLNGTVNAYDLPASVIFEYGTLPDYGNKIAAVQSPVTGYASVSVSANITDLKPGITYHFRIVATNMAGTAIGVDIPFTALGSVPSAETNAATNTAPHTAKLNGTVNAGYLPTVVTFEYGTTKDYGFSIPASQGTLTGSTTVTVTANPASLKPGETYHYRIVAKNDKGTTLGNDVTFTSEYVTGEFLYGGYIFYVDKTGEHGLVCAPSDQSQSSVWADCIPAGAAGRTVGTGVQNTADILRGCPEEGNAARLCSDLELNGYDDWFLPSVNELYLMYTNLHTNKLGAFSDSFYWSSTQDNFGAWVVSFYYGSKSNHSRAEDSIRTRAVRAF